LNRIFGTEANVRILRVLSLDPDPLTRTELARRARLEPKGAHLAAERLLEEGILARVGSGGLQHVALAETHPLTNAIRALFVAERERVDRLLEELRAAAKRLSNDINSAWIQGGVAADEDRPGEPVTVAALAPTSKSGTASKALRDAITPIEHAEDVTIDTKVYTRPDLVTLGAEEKTAFARILLLFGPSPVSIISQSAHADESRPPLHSNREAEELLLAEAIVRYLRKHPSRRRLALDYIVKRWNDASPQERHELEEWKAILQSSSTVRLERLLTAPGERSTRLRQTLPFLNLLSAEEREQVLARVRNDSR